MRTDLPSKMSQERKALWFVLAVAVAAHIGSIFTYRFDSDEPQHLHVAWGWTAGLVQYRDLFDNHAPLLHIVSAPLVALVGERSSILYVMRFAMLPCYFAMLWLTYRIATSLFTRRTALWSITLLSLFPPFFLKTIEYRNDNPWIVAWLAALFLIVSKRATFALGAAIGTLLGIAISFSMKTPMLLLALLLSGMVIAAMRELPSTSAWRTTPPWVGLAIFFPILPASIAGWFYLHGAWSDLIYCIFTFNERYPIAFSRRLAGVATLLLLLLPLILGAHFITVRSGNRQRVSARLFLFLSAGTYTTLVLGFWPIVTVRDFTPVSPLLMIFAAAWLVHHLAKEERLESTPRPVGTLRFATVIVALEVTATLLYGHLWLDQTKKHVAIIDTALALTRPGDSIMDLKGETVFRQRPFYYVMEKITRTELKRGMLRDDVVKSVENSGCTVVSNDLRSLSDRTREFFRAHFLEYKGLRVAGQIVDCQRSSVQRFQIAIANQYALTGDSGTVKGLLDGAPYAGARWLQRGWHVFQSRGTAKKVAVAWAPAVARGFSPFLRRSL